MAHLSPLCVETITLFTCKARINHTNALVQMHATGLATLSHNSRMASVLHFALISAHIESVGLPARIYIPLASVGTTDM